MNTQWIKEQIMALNADSKYQQLNAYYSKTTVFNILRAERNENRFSAFLCWLLNPDSNHGLHELPLKKLLALYAFESKDNALGSALMTGNYTITDVEECTNEKVVNDITNDKSLSRMDIWVLVDVMVDGNAYQIPIVIENKVYAQENDNQTEVYHKAIELYAGNKKNEGVSVVPVEIYLTPDNPKPCNSETFVNITYQKLLDHVLEPLVGLTEDNRSEIMISDFIKNLSVPAVVGDDNSTANGIKEKENTILAVSNREKSELLSVFDRFKELYCAALCVAGGDKARILFPYIDIPESESIELLDNLWNSNFSLFTTMLYVCKDNIAQGKETELINIFKASHRDTSKYLVEIQNNAGEWVVPAGFGKPMSKGKTVAVFFTNWKKNDPTMSLEYLREVFPSSLSNYYNGKALGKWGNSVVWNLTDGEDDKVLNAADKTHFVRTWVEAENGFSVKIADAPWDFYNQNNIGLHPYQGGTAYIVKMWRKDDFLRLLQHIEDNPELFKGIRIRKV